MFYPRPFHTTEYELTQANLYSEYIVLFCLVAYTHIYGSFNAEI